MPGSHWTFTACGSDTVTQLHGETLSYPLLLPASRRASAEVPLSSPLSSSGACSDSSSHLMGIMAGDTDLLTYSRGNTALLCSSYEIIAPFSLLVNRGVVVRIPSTGKLIGTFLKKVAERKESRTAGRKERSDVIASAQMTSKLS